MDKNKYKVECVLGTVMINQTIECDKVEWSEAGNYVFVNDMGQQRYDIVAMFPINKCTVTKLDYMEWMTYLM